MGMEPKKYKQYHISDVLRGEEYKDGERTFRGYGTDYSAAANNILYIMSLPLERLVSLKAFISSLKLNVSKESKIEKKKDSDIPTFKDMGGDISYNVTLDIPAESTNEALNNLAKLEELQRLILPTAGSKSGVVFKNVSNTNKVTQPLFRVWFKNIISNGYWSGTSKAIKYPTPDLITNELMKMHGFPCIIESISYEPDMDAGFFEFQNILRPKNIKLSLTLLVEAHTGIDIANPLKPALGFGIDGSYSFQDAGFFPFCVAFGTGGKYRETQNVQKAYWERILDSDDGGQIKILTTERINKVKILQGTKKHQPYFFMSLPISANSGNNDEGNRIRYVVFDLFMDSFKRTVSTDLTLINDTSSPLGRQLANPNPITFKELLHDFKINIVSRNLEEAIKNAAKIQYLIRMFFKQYDANDSTEIQKKLSQGQGTREATKLAFREVKVYIPNFLEAPKKSSSAADPNNFKEMFENAVSMYFSGLDFDINFDSGFFEDEYGRIFPKEMSIAVQLAFNDSELIKSYKYNDEKLEYSMIKSNKYPGLEHLFPFNQQTSKIKIGG